MIRDGTVPTITIDELREILRKHRLEIRKTENHYRNLGVAADMVLAVALNDIITLKSETEY